MARVKVAIANVMLRLGKREPCVHGIYSLVSHRQFFSFLSLLRGVQMGCHSIPSKLEMTLKRLKATIGRIL